MRQALNAIPQKSATLPKVRESKAVMGALAKLAKQSGVSESEAVRQLLVGYLKNPVEIQGASDVPRDGYLPPCRASEELLASLRLHAQIMGVSMSEVIRQAVRRGLGLTASTA